MDPSAESRWLAEAAKVLHDDRRGHFTPVADCLACPADAAALWPVVASAVSTLSAERDDYRDRLAAAEAHVERLCFALREVLVMADRYRNLDSVDYDEWCLHRDEANAALAAAKGAQTP